MKDKAGQQAQPDKAAQSASTNSVRGSSRREGSRAGPSAKVDLENSDSEQGGKEDPPSSDYQDRRVRSKPPNTKGPAIYAEVSNEVFKKARTQGTKRIEEQTNAEKRIGKTKKVINAPGLKA